jgi:tetratricopeptide (TPR) repeat protein
MNEEQVGEQRPSGTGQEQAPAWLASAMKNWKLFAGMAFVVTAIVAGMTWYMSTSMEKNQEANVQLSRIRAVFEAGEFEAALTADTVSPVGQDEVMGLLEISDQYGDTDAGKVAALMAGNCLVNLGRYDEAKSHFERAQSSGSATVEVGALQGLAVCTEAGEDLKGAAALYEQAAKRGLKSGLEAPCYYKAGLCYERSGDLDKAKECYEIVAKQYESSDVGPSAKSGLARLGMAID